MKVTLVSSNLQLLDRLKTTLTSTESVGACDVVERDAASTALYFAPTIKPTLLSSLLEVLNPIQPRLLPSERYQEGEARLVLGGLALIKAFHISLRGSLDVMEGVADTLSAIQFKVASTDEAEVISNELTYGAAPQQIRQLIKWLLAQQGITEVVERQLYATDDPTITLSVLDPRFASEDLLTRAPIELIGDDLEQLEKAKAFFKEQGVTNASIRVGDPSELTSFRCILGMLRRVRGGEALQEVVEGVMEHLAITDPEYAPSFVRGSLNESAKVFLPTAAFEMGEVLPSDPERLAHWSFILVGDDEDQVERLEDLGASLMERGIKRTEVITLPKSRDGDGLKIVMKWTHGALPPGEELVEEARGLLLELINGGDMSHIKPTVSVEVVKGDQDQCQVTLPGSVLDSEKYEEQIKEMSSGYDFRIKTEHQRDYGALLKHFMDYGFDSCEFTDNSCSSPEIKFGGAPRLLIDHISSVVADRTGHECKINKAWSDTDNDVWVYLPAPSQATKVEPTSEGPTVDSWFPPSEVKSTFVERAEGVVRIGDLLLPKREGDVHELSPDSKSFDHYCIDQRTADSLYHVAESVLIGEPCLLEGETSVSKTSVIQYLAMLMNQPVVRLNLNGQTDTGELVGRYLPTSSVNELPISPRELTSQAGLLNEESRQILARVEDENRPLTSLEVQRIIAREHLPQRTWSWQNGAIVNAIRHGWWVILDELNLAEPQILERLNSLLELNPSLVLTERDNRIFGSESHPIHPNFRIFGTMNPAEYSGRMTLSPAYRDRWTGYRYVERPHEEDYLAMLRYLVFGEQPQVTCFGRTYGAPKKMTAPFAHLAKIPDIDQFLESLARFQSSLERAVDQTGSAQIGGRRREPYIFTRRGLIGAIRFIATDLHPERSSSGRSFDMRASICRYYINRISTPEDRVILFNLLDAVGLGLKSWNQQL